MCGFCGFTGNIDNGLNVINKMTERIAHRGPDSSGVHIDDEICLGFRRLSFVDLTEGNQPMYNEDSSIVIVFNGEIYNYKELREEMIKAGHILSNQSDTETLVHLYEQYGCDMLKHLRGMFAFVIYDSIKKQVFAARDFFGIKPFYYSIIDGNLLFGSEIKSFLEYPAFVKEVNPEALENYLTFQYSVLNETFFKGVYKLPPAHYMIFKDGKVSLTKYAEHDFNENDMNIEQTVARIDEVVKDSIEKHKIADVEIGSFLSSGVDSSYVASCSSCEKTFTVGFDYEKYNEVEYAKSLCEKLHINNYNKIITTDEYWASLGKVQYHMDEPLADSSAVALYFVSKVASDYVKAALSGEGADEFFGGYNIYKEPLDMMPYAKLPLPVRAVIGKLASLIPFSIKGKNFLIRAGKTVEGRFIGNANIFTKKEREKILINPIRTYAPSDITKPYYEAVKKHDDITKMQYIDIHFWLVGDILLKADKMSMANSLEVRVPFLDKEVFKVASAIPTKFRVGKSGTKLAFRLAAKKHLPDEVAKKKKLGFPVPIRIWLREEKYYNIVREAFCSEAAAKYFKSDEILKLLDRHKSGKKDNSRKIWTIFMFLIWYEEFFGEKTNKSLGA